MALSFALKCDYMTDAQEKKAKIPDFLSGDEPTQTDDYNYLEHEPDWRDGLRFYAKISLGAAALVSAVVATVPPRPDRPFFETFRHGDCIISRDATWRYGIGGIHAMVLAYVKGVTSEGGKGSECLDEVKEVIAHWSQGDFDPLNDLDPQEYNPIIRNDRRYPIPM